MACLFALLAVSVPRVALLFTWIFTPLVNRAFATFVGPLLGIAFLPFTTLMYVLLFPVVGWAWIWIALAVLVDLASYAGSAYSNRREIQGYPGEYPGGA
jgi:hypothetical protein